VVPLYLNTCDSIRPESVLLSAYRNGERTAVFTGVNRLLNWSALMLWVPSVVNGAVTGSAWARGAARPAPRPRVRARANCFMSRDLPGLIRQGADRPAPARVAP